MKNVEYSLSLFFNVQFDENIMYNMFCLTCYITAFVMITSKIFDL